MENTAIVKEIQFKVKIKGHGVVQTDSNDQKYLMKGKSGFGGINLENNNYLFSKKTMNQDGSYKIKITQDKIKRYMRGDVRRFTSSVLNTGIEAAAITAAHPLNLLFGWLVTRPDQSAFKKRGSVAMSCAEQCNNAKSFLEVCKADDIVSQNQTSLSFRETVGDIEYMVEHGFINLKELQFISVDATSERIALDEEIEKVMYKYLSMSLPNFSGEADYYRNKENILKDTMYEKGILFNNEQLVYLVKYFFKSLLGFNIRVPNGFAEIEYIDVCFVTDIVNEIGKTEDEKNYIRITSNDEVDKFNFLTESVYEKVPEDELWQYNLKRVEFEKEIQRIRVAQVVESDKKKEQKKQKLETKNLKKEEDKKKLVEKIDGVE